ncbi:hypothetical protein BVH03_17685 [Pseudomonas sp. PA15(2017)]|uniref:hypothetical protein n=1 Tax=Pseudomonas sp. PA15(2017) TaxID=1932111 RepID=UPI00095CA3C4|nr:hypothetical protein [Pseudomonas sp. PA15(2017)]OLU25486.1 hypothetical protein BVH03_17685 [Pseudomonas sp. PA15(2017)]
MATVALLQKSTRNKSTEDAFDSKGFGMTLRTVYKLTVLAANGCYFAPRYVNVRALMLDGDSQCLYTPIRWLAYEVIA